MTTITRQVRDFLDIDFSFVKHPVTNNVSVKKNVSAIKQSVTNLLMLREGDKPFHPEIKSPIYEYLFSNATNITKIVLEGEIKKYLGYYEPRIDVLDVNVQFPDKNYMMCVIFAKIINITEPITINIMIDRLR